jgi:hypothetical protein
MQLKEGAPTAQTPGILRAIKRKQLITAPSIEEELSNSNDIVQIATLIDEEKIQKFCDEGSSETAQHCEVIGYFVAFLRGCESG